MDDERYKVLGEITKKAKNKPILVGGAAVELYTSGMFNTADLDIIAAKGEILKILEGMDFVRDGTYFKRGNVFIHLLRSDFDGRTDDIKLSGTNFVIRVISIEDLIIERMKGWKFFRSARDKEQAQYLVDVFYGNADMDYLEARADEQEVMDILEEMVVAYHRFKATQS